MAGDLPRILLQGNPRIFMQYFQELDHLIVNPISLQEGEPEIVGKTLRDLFLKYREKSFCKNKTELSVVV